MLKKWNLASCVLAFLLVTSANAQSMRATHLRTEYLENPIGIGDAAPRLSWWCESPARGDKQTAYQILVASSPEKLKSNKGDLWNTGKVKSDETTQIEYAGDKLRVVQTAWWKVRVWDKNGKASSFSAPATWERGLASNSDWVADWIGRPRSKKPDPSLTGGNWIWFPEGDPSKDAPLEHRYFRATFDIGNLDPIVSAEMWGAVDDHLVAFLNGKRLGDVDSFHRIGVLIATPHLRPGRNVLAIDANNTGGPAALNAVLHVTYKNGTSKNLLAANKEWLTSNKKTKGWEQMDFNASSWSKSKVVGRVGDQPWPDPRPNVKLGEVTYFRKDVVVEGKLHRARIYASAKGLYKLTIDGKPVGKDLFAPGWTDYNKRVQYRSYDVTKFMTKGRHTIGVMLADGWYAGHVGWGAGGEYGHYPMALVQLELTNINPLRQTFASNEEWKCTTGPIRTSDLMMGEDYDARKEMIGWDKPGFDDSKWLKSYAEPVGRLPLVPQPDEPVEVWNELPTKSVSQPKRGTYVFDLGQNMVGWARLKVKGDRGKKVQLRFAEVLNPDGTLYTTNLRGAKATDTYTLKGGATEVYEPSFTFHGFRYVEVTGYPGKPTKSAITGVVAGSAMPTTGTFECSNPMVNKLQHNIYWGMRGNYLSIPTDCPQRDERLGWMGDAQIFTPTATFLCDVAPFMTKWLQDVRDGQGPNGAFADVSPRILMGDAAPAWGDAGVIVPWSVYEAYGDKRLLAQSYPSMKKWVDYIHAANPKLLWTIKRGNDYGDWLSIKADTPKDVLATAFFARSTDLVARSAKVLGKTADAKKYAALFAGIKTAFNKKYVGRDGRITGDTQTCYALALAFDLLPEELKSAAAGYLADDIEHKHEGHLSTGFVGVKYLAPALAESGRIDLAYRLLLNDTFPSWMYSIKQGATTIWERWDGYTKEKGFQDPGMNSFNHYSFGAIGEWMYSTIGGLQMTSPGWKTFRIHPQDGGGINWAKTGFDSPHGHIQCNWSWIGGEFRMHLTVPANTVAEVWLPYNDKTTEGSRDITKAPDIQQLPLGPVSIPFHGYRGLRVGSGSYVFRVEWGIL